MQDRNIGLAVVHVKKIWAMQLDVWIKLNLSIGVLELLKRQVLVWEALIEDHVKSLDIQLTIICFGQV